MTDRQRRPGRRNPETSPSRHTSGIPTTETTPKEDLSGTVQDPDARPPTTAPGGNLPGPDLPRTEEGELDFSSIGRSEPKREAEEQERGDARPAHRRVSLPRLREPRLPEATFDLAPFRREDSYDMQAMMVVRRNWERMRREEEQRRRILGRMWAGGERGGRQRPPRVRVRGVEGGTLLSNLSEKSSGCERGEKGEGAKKVAGGGADDEDDLYGASPVRSSPPKGLPAKKGDEPENEQEKEKEEQSEDEDDLYGASPVRPSPPKGLPAKQEDTGKEKKEQEKRPEDKKSHVAFGKPKSPKVSPVKEQGSLWCRLFSRAQKASPTKSEKYRRLAANETTELTEKEKFDYWMKDELSSPRAFVADEKEWQTEMELLYAREKYIAQLQQAKADASAMISQGDKERRERQELEEMINQCNLHLQEAEELEDKRQRRRSLQASLDLETSPTFIAKFNDQLRDLNGKIEDGEKKEKLRLKPWVDVSSDWSARLQKAADMTPSERAASSTGRGLHAPARPPGQLKQSSAEKALRLQWAAEDSPHEDELLEIQTYSDKTEQDVAWELAMRKRQSVLLARHKVLSDLWTKQAEEMRADRESAWLESKGEKRIPSSGPQSRVASMKQSKALREGTGESGAGQSDVLSDKQKREKKDEEDKKKEVARKEAEGPKKIPGAETEDAGRLGERHRLGKRGIFNTSGPRQTPEMEPGSSPIRKKSSDVTPKLWEKAAPGSRKSTTPEKSLSPFRAIESISPLQEGRKKPEFHADSEVSEYLESLTQYRLRFEMQKEGVEMVDLDVMRKLVDAVAKPIWIGIEGAAENVAAMERRATRIREAKERLAWAAKKEVERQRKDEEKKKKQEEKEEGGEGKLSFKEMMEKLKKERAERQEKEQKRQRIELERRKKEEEDMAVEREEKRRDRAREDRQREREELLEWIADRVKRRKLERERSGKQESRTNKEMRELKEKEEEEEEDERRREMERRQKKREEGDDRERKEEKERIERADRERREIYEREVTELKEIQEKEKKDEREKRVAYICTEREISTKKDELKRQERENEEIIESKEREERERKAKAENEVKERTERAKGKLKEDYEREMKELEDSKRDDQARRDRKEQYEREAEERAKRQREENEQRKIKEAEVKARREREQQARRELIRKAERDMQEFEKNQMQKELEQQRELMDREIADRLKKESDEKRQREQRERREEEARQREELGAEERENAERQRVIDDEFDSGDEEQYGLIEQHFLKYFICVLSWFKRRDPESTEAGSSVHSRGSLHSVLDSPDNSLDSKTTSFGTPPPETIDPNSPPDSPSWLRHHGPDLPTLDYIHLHLTIFSSPDQRHPNPSTPIYYATYSDVPLWWNVSQLKRFLGRGSFRSKELHGRGETFPGCAGWVKEDGKAIEEGDAEEKKMRLRVAGRWLKSGGRTLRDEGLRDYENLVVVLVGPADDLGRRAWRNCLVEADGVAGFKEGWPGKGEIRAPADRVAWLGEAMDGVFGVFGGGVEVGV